MKAISIPIAAFVLLACSSESTTSPPLDAGKGGDGGAAGATAGTSAGGMGGGPDTGCQFKDPALCDGGTDSAGGEGPLPDPDDGGCKLPNGGITCDSSLDCPPADACTCYRCEPFGLAGTLTCVAYSQDAGACGQ